MSTGWIGVDLDGTLAHYDGWIGVEHIGEPIEPMLQNVKKWIAEGWLVKIFTARVARNDAQGARPHIEAWCQKHLGVVLEVTNEKDFGMVMLYDDRCTQVQTNTGLMLKPAEQPQPEHQCYFCKEPVENETFCFGCGIFVCESCNTAMPMGSHSPEDHLDSDDGAI